MTPVKNKYNKMSNPKISILERHFNATIRYIRGRNRNRIDGALVVFKKDSLTEDQLAEIAFELSNTGLSDLARDWMDSLFGCTGLSSEKKYQWFMNGKMKEFYKYIGIICKIRDRVLECEVDSELGEHKARQLKNFNTLVEIIKRGDTDETREAMKKYNRSDISQENWIQVFNDLVKAWHDHFIRDRLLDIFGDLNTLIGTHLLHIALFRNDSFALVKCLIDNGVPLSDSDVEEALDISNDSFHGAKTVDYEMVDYMEEIIQTRKEINNNAKSARVRK
jgi:hypothetical protein